MMAWLGTALKSSQPSFSARCRSEKPMVWITGAAAAPCPLCVKDVTLPCDGVAMIVVSLWRTRFYALPGRKRAVSKNDHDQTRRADRSVKLAMSRTEGTAYSQSRADALTLQ